jgi:hypothetical protein
MRPRCLIAQVCFVLCIATAAQAQPARMIDIYDSSTLTYWQARYQGSMQRMLDQALLPVFAPNEVAALSGLRLQVPQLADYPFDFWSRSDMRVVFMPASGLKFLDDIATAYTWLSSHGYSEETIEDYVVMLRYKPSSAWPEGHPPSPLRALGVPDAAADDNRALSLFNSMRAFILAHEIGHVLHRHSCSMVAYENEADAFALDVMARAGELPVGAVLFFTISTLWFQEPGARSDPFAQCGHGNDHPISAERLYAIADQTEARAALFAQGQPNRSVAVQIAHGIALATRQLAQDHLDPSNPETVELQNCVIQNARRANSSVLLPRARGTPSPLRC